ncbi:MAG TPA: dethiobiotin synthase [Candidatus Baltobacteraceae bacterium]
MSGYFVTGTDTDVGKTRVVATLARALRERNGKPTIVKCVQTGCEPGVPGDAARAGALAQSRFVELARFAKPADPWSAALAQGAPPLAAADLAAAIGRIAGMLVVEGAGGIAVPLNADETLADVARLCGLETIVAVGLRLGCISHARLTLAYCERAGLRVGGVVLVERWSPVEPDYREDVERALQDKARVLGILPFCADEPAAVTAGVSTFSTLIDQAERKDQ